MSCGVEVDAEADDGGENLAQEEKDSSQKCCTFSASAVQDDVDGEAFEVLESSFCHCAGSV